MIVQVEKTLDSRPIIESITTWKEEHGYTWEEVSKRTGIARSTLYLWGRGKKNANIDSLLTLSQTTGIPLEQLLGSKARVNIAVSDCPIDIWGLFTSERGRALLLEAMEKVNKKAGWFDKNAVAEKLKLISAKADYLV